MQETRADFRGAVIVLIESFYGSSQLSPASETNYGESSPFCTRTFRGLSYINNSESAFLRAHSRE